MTRITWFLLIFLFLPLSLAYGSAPLYPNEKLLSINGFPALIRFNKGEPNKPLVIFVPGNSHLARIAYGYPFDNPKDFLNYWLNKKGYSFLGISYPTDNPVYAHAYPGFTIKDWGQQIAEVARQVIVKNKLSKHIVVLGWSMGGAVEETVNIAAKQKGLIVDVFIGLSAVPPLPYIMQHPPYKIEQLLKNGLADRRILYPWFTKALEEQDQYNHHVIIPRAIYLREFLGNIPIALGAEGYHYQNGRVMHNVEKTLQDSGVFNFQHTPWLAIIRDDSPALINITYIDPAAWNLLRMEMLYSNYLAKKNLAKVSPLKWGEFKKNMDRLANDLTCTVHGNHFFFVGEKGAKETADKIELLITRSTNFKRWFANMTQ